MDGSMSLIFAIYLRRKSFTMRELEMALCFYRALVFGLT